MIQASKLAKAGISLRLKLSKCSFALKPTSNRFASSDSQPMPYQSRNHLHGYNGTYPCKFAGCPFSLGTRPAGKLACPSRLCLFCSRNSSSTPRSKELHEAHMAVRRSQTLEQMHVGKAVSTLCALSNCKEALRSQTGSCFWAITKHECPVNDEWPAAAEADVRYEHHALIQDAGNVAQLYTQRAL